MKRIMKTFLLMLSLIAEVSLYSQSFTVGAKGGPNYSNIEGYYSFISSYRQSVSGGVFLILPLTRHVESILEINYEQKGFKYTSQDFSNNTRIEGKHIYDYLTMPVGFKYKFGKNVQPFFKAGIFLAILMNAIDIGTEIDYAVQPPVSNSWENYIMHETEPVDLGAFFSFGIQSNISPKLLLFAEGSLNYGLIMLEPDKIFVEEMRNRSFLVSFGFGYRL